MKPWMATCVVLLAGTALAEPTPALVVGLDCYDAWKSGNLSEAGGGPGGAQWNTEAVVCSARIEPVSAPGVQSVWIRLQMGQGKTFALVGELYSPAAPRQVLAQGEGQPSVDAIATVARGKPSFFIPAALFKRALRKKSRQAETGATVYSMRFLVTARGLDAKGRVLASAHDEVRAEFAFGE